MGRTYPRFVAMRASGRYAYLWKIAAKRGISFPITWQYAVTCPLLAKNVQVIKPFCK
jgi:hypothetical protein